MRGKCHCIKINYDRVCTETKRNLIWSGFARKMNPESDRENEREKKEITVKEYDVWHKAISHFNDKPLENASDPARTLRLKDLCEF